MIGSVKLIYGEKEYQLPIVEGSEGEKAIDISKLRQETGLITLDPGYANTGSCASSITFMDGEKGVLRYRGIPVEQLAEKSTFKETAYLLINGKLPKQKELTNFSVSVTFRFALSAIAFINSVLFMITSRDYFRGN